MLPVDSPFPELKAQTAQDETLRLPADIPTAWAVMVGYRADW